MHEDNLRVIILDFNNITAIGWVRFHAPDLDHSCITKPHHIFPLSFNSGLSFKEHEYVRGMMVSVEIDFQEEVNNFVNRRRKQKGLSSYSRSKLTEYSALLFCLRQCRWYLE